MELLYTSFVIFLNFKEQIGLLILYERMKTITYHGSGHAHSSPQFCESVHGLLHDGSEALCRTNTKHEVKDIKL